MDLEAAVSSITNAILVKLSELKEYSEFTIDFQEELANSIKNEIKKINVDNRNKAQVVEPPGQEEPLQVPTREEEEKSDVIDAVENFDDTKEPVTSGESEVQVVEPTEQTEEPLEDNQHLPVSTREEEEKSDVSVVEEKSESLANKLDRVESLVLALYDMESSNNNIEAKAESDREEASALQVTDAVKENTSEGKKSTNKWTKAFDLVTGLLSGLLTKISQNFPVVILGLLVAFRLYKRHGMLLKTQR